MSCKPEGFPATTFPKILPGLVRSIANFPKSLVTTNSGTLLNKLLKLKLYEIPSGFHKLLLVNLLLHLRYPVFCQPIGENKDKRA